MLVTLGGRFGGYGLYVLKGIPVFTYNLVGLARFRWEGTASLMTGKHTIVFDFIYDRPGPGNPFPVYRAKSHSPDHLAADLEGKGDI
jgi:hypothetical protein